MGKKRFKASSIAEPYNTCICRNGKNLHNPNFDENRSKTTIYSEEVERFYIKVETVSKPLIWVYISLRYIIFRRLRYSKHRGFHEQPPRFIPKTNIITSIAFLNFGDSA